jgi:hypothetical protein
MLPSTGGVEAGTEGFSVEQVLRVWRCGGVEVRPTWSSCAALFSLRVKGLRLKGLPGGEGAVTVWSPSTTGQCKKPYDCHATCQCKQP